MNAVILIPSLNPDNSLLQLICDLCKLNVKNIVVVNDGSDISCFPIFDTLEKKYGCTVISHEINKGKGAALKTGIAAIKDKYPDTAGIITADADGQHSPNDIVRIAGILNGNPACFILGARDFSKENVPFKSRYGNKITSSVFFLTTGRRCADTQTGLRGIPLFLADELLKINGSRFEYETNVLIKLSKNNINFIEVPIDTIYKNDNRETHFRPVRDSIIIYAQIIKFMLSSLFSFIIDITLFTVFYNTVFSVFVNKTIYSTVAARLLSGIFNYNVNKRMVFRSKEKNSRHFIKYVSLFLTQMFLSSGLVKLLENIEEINIALLKAAVDTVLFIFSFIIQKVFIFKNNKIKVL